MGKVNGKLGFWVIGNRNLEDKIRVVVHIHKRTRQKIIIIIKGRQEEILVLYLNTSKSYINFKRKKCYVQNKISLNWIMKEISEIFPKRISGFILFFHCESLFYLDQTSP